MGPQMIVLIKKKKGESIVARILNVRKRFTIERVENHVTRE